MRLASTGGIFCWPLCGTLLRYLVVVLWCFLYFLYALILHDCQCKSAIYGYGIKIGLIAIEFCYHPILPAIKMDLADPALLFDPWIACIRVCLGNFSEWTFRLELQIIKSMLRHIKRHSHMRVKMNYIIITVKVINLIAQVTPSSLQAVPGMEVASSPPWLLA